MASEVSVLKAVYEADSSGFDRALDSIQGGIGKTVGALAGLAGAIGVSFAAGDSIQKALEFDKALANIRSVTGDTAEKTAELGDMLKNTAMSSAIPGGLDAISASYYDIVGGVQGAAAQQEIFNAAVATAEAGQADLGAVTGGLISTVNAYGSANLSAATASDILTKTVGMGVGSMDEFVAAMGPLSGLAATSGVKFENLGAMMAYMTSKGTSASQSATQIKAAMTSLLNPNKEMAAALKKMGVDSGSAALEMYGLEGTLGRLQTAMGGSTDAMAKAMGSTEALQAAVAINSAGYEDFLGTFQDTMSGATEAARALQLESVSAQFQIFQNTLSGIGLSIGQAFLPALNTLLGGFNAFAGDVQKMGLGPAIEKWWNAGIDWLNQKGADVLQGALKMALDIGQDIVTFVQTNGPNVVAGVIGLWEGVKTWFKDTGSGMFEEGLKSAFKLGQDIAAFVLANAPNVMRGVETWLGDAWTWIQNNIGDKLGGALKIGFGLIGDLATLIKENAPDIGLAVGNWIRGAFTGLGSILQDALAGLFSGGAVDTSGLQGGDIAASLIPPPTVFEQLAQGAMDAMTGVFQTGINLISGLFEGLFGLDKGAIKGFFDAFLGTEGPIAKFKTGIISVWNSIFGKTGALQTAVDALAGGIGGVFETLKTTVFGILKPLLEPLATLMKAISLAFYALGDGEHAKAAADAALAIEGMKATGGPVMAGRNYIVGEKGPEVLKMGGSSGSVIPNNRLNSVGGDGGGGGLTLHGVNIYGVENAETFLDKLMEEAGRRGLQLTF